MKLVKQASLELWFLDLPTVTHNGTRKVKHKRRWPVEKRFPPHTKPVGVTCRFWQIFVEALDEFSRKQRRSGVENGNYPIEKQREHSRAVLRSEVAKQHCAFRSTHDNLVLRVQDLLDQRLLTPTLTEDSG